MHLGSLFLGFSLFEFSCSSNSLGDSGSSGVGDSHSLLLLLLPSCSYAAATFAAALIAADHNVNHLLDDSGDSGRVVIPRRWVQAVVLPCHCYRCCCRLIILRLPSSVVAVVADIYACGQTVAFFV
jgi:hypothetical protein